MMAFISKTLTHIRTWLKTLKIQTNFLVAAIGILLVVTPATAAQSDRALGEAVERRADQTDQADRPKTMNEWKKEARATEGKPLKRLERIAKESGEAFKQFGSGYVEGAKKTAGEINEGTAKIGKDLK